MTKEKVSKDAKFESAEVNFPPVEESSRLLIACRPSDYMASEIARAVEDADARLLNLNVTAIDCDGLTVTALRVARRDPQPVARSLERYGYTIVECTAAHADDDTLRDRYNELMHILSI